MSERVAIVKRLKRNADRISKRHQDARKQNAMVEANKQEKRVTSHPRERGSE
jgi:hypothetical protein